MKKNSQKFAKSQAFVKFGVFIAIVFYVGSFFTRESSEPNSIEILNNPLFAEFDSLLKNTNIDLEFVQTIRQKNDSIQSVIVPEVRAGRKNPFVPTL